MDNIVNFGDFKEKKNKKSAAMNSNQSSSTYFVILGNEKTGTTKFRFGGAFVRDFIARVKDNKEEIKSQVTMSYNVMLEKFKSEENASEYVNVYLGKQTLIGIVDLLVDEFTFDELFEDENLASQAGMVIGIVVFSYYTYDDIEKMQDDQWIDCELDVVKTIFDEINEPNE